MYVPAICLCLSSFKERTSAAHVKYHANNRDSDIDLETAFTRHSEIDKHRMPGRYNSTCHVSLNHESSVEVVAVMGVLPELFLIIFVWRVEETKNERRIFEKLEFELLYEASRS